jgi:hypothetical protein
LEILPCRGGSDHGEKDRKGSTEATTHRTDRESLNSPSPSTAHGAVEKHREESRGVGNAAQAGEKKKKKPKKKRKMNRIDEITKGITSKLFTS